MRSKYSLGIVSGWNDWDDTVWPFQPERNAVEVGYTQYRIDGHEEDPVNISSIATTAEPILHISKRKLAKKVKSAEIEGANLSTQICGNLRVVIALTLEKTTLSTRMRQMK